jgi:hypothetical protein
LSKTGLPNWRARLVNRVPQKDDQSFCSDLNPPSPISDVSLFASSLIDILMNQAGIKASSAITMIAKRILEDAYRRSRVADPDWVICEAGRHDWVSAHRRQAAVGDSFRTST